MLRKIFLAPSFILYFCCYLRILNQDLSLCCDLAISQQYFVVNYFLIWLGWLHLIYRSCSLICGCFVSRASFFLFWIPRLYHRSSAVIAFHTPRCAGQPLMLPGRTLGTWWSLLSQVSSGMESKPEKCLAHRRPPYLVIASFHDHSWALSSWFSYLSCSERNTSSVFHGSKQPFHLA